MTTEGGDTPPAGWYQDPHGARAWRYWDGTAWTDHVSEWPVAAAVPQLSPEERVAEERRWARYARWAFVAFAPVQIAAQVLGALKFDRTYHGTLLTDDAPRSTSLFDPPAIGVPQVLCSLAVLGLTLVLAYWTMQAARAAQAQGITIARSPGWTMGGWFIPILNLWWPPQSIRSFAEDRRSLPVVGWWICFIVATVAAVTATIVAGAEDVTASIPFLVVGAAAVVSFSVLGIQLVNLVLDVHERGVRERV